MWTLQAALELIRGIQPGLHAQKYHVALGGSVLNRGSSEKDLDLYFFPFDVSDIPPILPYLENMWGISEDLIKRGGNYPPDVNFQEKRKFQMFHGRIDVFITKNGVTAPCSLGF